jgi:hypothetical protein
MHSKLMRRHIVRSSLRAGVRRASLILGTSKKLSPAESTYLTAFVKAAGQMISQMAKDKERLDFALSDFLRSPTTARNLAERAHVATIYELALCDLPTLRPALHGTRVHMKDILVAMRYMSQPPRKRTRKK